MLYLFGLGCDQADAWILWHEGKGGSRDDTVAARPVDNDRCFASFYPDFFAGERRTGICDYPGGSYRVNWFVFGLRPMLRPSWLTLCVYLFSVLIGAGLIYMQIRLRRARASLEKESELYQAKIDFVANMSHDARTHISLIDGLLEEALRLLNDDQEAKHHLGHAKNNSQQLIQLLNELLDYHKTGNGDIKLSVYEYDLVKTIETVLTSFEHIGLEKKIRTRFIHPDPPVNVWFDFRQIQNVFNNLLTNAYKFTPENGWVTIEIVHAQDLIVVNVTNSGLGISTNDIRRLFEKFFLGQHLDPRERHDTDLSRSKTIIDLHHARLTVSSQRRGAGQDGQTCFSVGFLGGSSHYSSGQFAKSKIYFTNDSSVDSGAIYRQGASGQAEKKFTVLLIEHNDEIRALEFGLLSESYHILEAVSGTDGLKMAFESIPDLILCDVVLPEQNGIEICSQLKADIRTSHIPIVLLAWQSALFQVIQGLQAGADDYLVQPVDASILLLKIQNLIKTRTAIRDYAGKTLSSRPDEWLNAGTNDEFINKLRSLVIENISQPNFGVNEMAFQVGMSVSVLYRKVRSLTGMTVNDFMKTIKMQKALYLLESGSYQVNEVALMVGYESVRYFSNEFKKVYGKNPSKFRSISSEH